MKYRIYRNLHKKCWSLAQKQDDTWQVINHVDQLVADNVEFHVSEAGRRRVLVERCKNVHAWALAEFVTPWTGPAEPRYFAEQITYNPYVAALFHRVETAVPLDYAYAVWFRADGTVWAESPNTVDSTVVILSNPGLESVPIPA